MKKRVKSDAPKKRVPKGSVIKTEESKEVVPSVQPTIQTSSESLKQQEGLTKLLEEIFKAPPVPLPKSPHAVDDDATCASLNATITEYLDSYILIGYDAFRGRRLTICATKTNKDRDALVEAIKNTLYMMLGSEPD